VLHSGPTVWVGGNSKWRAAAPETLAGIRQAARRHTVSAGLAGRPVREGEPDLAALYADPGGKPGLRQWTGTEWSPFLEVDPVGSGPEGEKGPARVWSPLPEAEQQRQWDAAASRVKMARFDLALVLVMMAGCGAWVLAAFVYELTKPRPDFGPSLVAVPILLVLLWITWSLWKKYQVCRKAGEAAKAAARAGAVDSTASVSDDHDDDPPAGVVPMRCPECGAGSTEVAEICPSCEAALSPPVRPKP
jgi:hypothetical protein